MKKYILLKLLCLITQWALAQTEIYSQVENDFNLIAINFKKYLPSKESESFEDFIEKFNNNASTYLGGGFGLTFEELNKVRVMKKFSTAFENFYSALRYGSNKMPCSMKDIRLVIEYFPEITINAFKSYEGSLILYKIEIDKFCVYLARHTDKKSIKTIYYNAKLGRTTQSGNMGLAYKCVRKIIDNVDFGFSKSIYPVIVKQENIDSMLDTFSFCTAE